MGATEASLAGDSVATRAGCTTGDPARQRATRARTAGLDCSGCGPQTDWPCEYARAELTANLDPISRSMYAAERMVEAIADLPDETTPGEIQHG